MELSRMDGTGQLRRRKMLAATAIIGSVSILTALGILAVLHLMVYFPAATGILLGLHLLPLAGMYREPLFRVFGWALAAWSAGCLLLGSHIAAFSAAGEAALVMALAALVMARKPRRRLAD